MLKDVSRPHSFSSSFKRFVYLFHAVEYGDSAEHVGISKHRTQDFEVTDDPHCTSEVYLGYYDFSKFKTFSMYIFL